jgi:heme-degrading monooxygenase HmoA
MNKEFTPYYAVIFTSKQSANLEGYQKTSERMEKLVKNQVGFLGMDTAKSDIGITVSYWDSLESIKNWKQNLEHQIAQKSGKEKWYTNYKVRICEVLKEYSFNK